MFCFTPGATLSVNEGMCKFAGRLGFVQYMLMKPIKRGIKVWMAAVPGLGYVSTFDVYTGKQQSLSGKGLLYNIVFKLSRPFLNAYRTIAFDNFFTSVPLVRDLLKRKTYAVGMVRKNRKGLPPQLNNIKLKRHKLKMFQNGSITTSVWRDKGSSKNAVCVLSTGQLSNTVEVDRCSRAHVDHILCPAPISSYNQKMGGVDLADQHRTYYRIGRCSTRWWTYLFLFFVDTAIVNAYVLYRFANAQLPKISQRN